MAFENSVLRILGLGKTLLRNGRDLCTFLELLPKHLNN